MKSQPASRREGRNTRFTAPLLFLIALVFIVGLSFSSTLKILVSSNDSTDLSTLDTVIPHDKHRGGTELQTGYFLPGSLDLTREESIKRCYVDLNSYKQHKRGNMCTFSSKYGLFYILLPKSGSSTGRHVMKHSFDAKEYFPSDCNKFLMGKHKELQRIEDDIIRTVSLRNPMSRFFASYDEMFVRKLNNGWKSVPSKYKNFCKDFPNWEYKDYEAAFNTDIGITLLTDAFEQFVADFDGEIIFDEHLQLQMPALTADNGFTFPFEYVIDTKEMKTAFEDIASIVGAPKPEVIRGRSYPRRFDTARLSKETIRKICKLSLLDFCCLNYELPPECLEDDIPEGERPVCRWETRTVNQRKESFVVPDFI